MKVFLKRLDIAMRYNSRGEPISIYKHVPEPELELHAFSTDVPKGFKKYGAYVATKYGQYRVLVLIEKATGAVEVTYEHKALIPMPCGCDYEIKA